MATTYRIRLTDGIAVDVTGDYYPGFAGTREDPPEPESVTFRSVVIGGVDVIDSLTDEQLFKIECAWLQARSDAYDAFIENLVENGNFAYKQPPATWKR